MINKIFGFITIILLYSYIIFKSRFNFKQSRKYLEIIIECIKLIGDVLEEAFSDDEGKDKPTRPSIRLVK
jgi:hypothetical protein